MKPILQMVAEEYINFVIDNTVPRSMTIDEIREATKSDNSMQTVIQHILHGDWYKSVNDANIEPYSQVKDELNVSQDCILLRGARDVVNQLIIGYY